MNKLIQSSDQPLYIKDLVLYVISKYKIHALFGIIGIFVGLALKELINIDFVNLVLASILSFTFVSCIFSVVKYLFDGTIKVPNEIESFGIKVIKNSDDIHGNLPRLSTLKNLESRQDILSKRDIIKTESKEYILVEKLKATKRSDVIEIINFATSEEKEIKYCILVNDNEIK